MNADVLDQPRSRRPWLLLAVAVLVVAVVAAALVWARGYEPLARGSIAQQPAGSTESEGELHLPWRPGSTQEVMVSVRNTGRLPITVERPDYGRPELSPVQVLGARWAVQGVRGTEGFHDFPAKVAPGDEITIRVRVQQRECGWDPCGGAGYDLIPLRTSTFWQEHTWTASAQWRCFDVVAPRQLATRFQTEC